MELVVLVGVPVDEVGLVHREVAPGDVLQQTAQHISQYTYIYIYKCAGSYLVALLLRTFPKDRWFTWCDRLAMTGFRLWCLERDSMWKFPGTLYTLDTAMVSASYSTVQYSTVPVHEESPGHHAPRVDISLVLPLLDLEIAVPFR